MSQEQQQQPSFHLVFAHNGTVVDSSQTEFPADAIFLREDDAKDTNPSEFASLQTNVYVFSETLFKQVNQFQLQPPMLQQLLENESRELDDDDATDFFKTAEIQLNFIRGAARVAHERANSCAEFRFKQAVQQTALSLLLQNVTSDMHNYESKYNETEKTAQKQFAILGSEQLPSISHVLFSLSRATAYDGKPLLEQSGIDTSNLENDFNACMQAKETILKQLEYLKAFLSAGKARLNQDTQNVNNKKLLVQDWDALLTNIQEKLNQQYQILNTYEQNYALLAEKKKEELSFECLGIIQELKSQNFIDRVKDIDNALRIDCFKCAEKKMSFDQEFFTVIQNLYKLKKRIVLCIQPVEASAQKTMEYKAGIARLKLAAQLSTLYTKSVNEAIRRKQFKQQLVTQVDKFSSMLKMMRDTENTARLSFDNELRTSLDQEEVPYNILVPGLSATVPELAYQIPSFDEQLPSTIEPPEDFEDISEHDVKAPEASSSSSQLKTSAVPENNWNASQVIDLVSNHALSAIQQLPQVSQSSNLVKSVEEIKESLPEKVDEAEEVDSDAEVVVDEEKNGSSSPQAAQGGALGESFSSVTQPHNEELQAEITKLEKEIQELNALNEQYQKRIGQLEFENEMKQSSLDGANQRIDELSLSLKALQLNAVSSTHQDTQLVVTNEQQANSFAEVELEQLKQALSNAESELQETHLQYQKLAEATQQFQSQNGELQEQLKTHQIERLSMEEQIMNLTMNLQQLEGGYVALQQTNAQLEERVRTSEQAASSSHGEIENYIDTIRHREAQLTELSERLAKNEETTGKLRQVISTTIPRMQTVAVLDSCIKTADSFLPEVEQSISSLDRQGIDLVQTKFTTNEQDKAKYVAITGQQIELIAKQVQQYFNVLEAYCEATGTTYASVLKSLHIKTKELQALASELTSFSPTQPQQQQQQQHHPQQHPQPVAPTNNNVIRPSAPSAQPQPQPLPQPQTQPPKMPLSGSMYPGSSVPSMPPMPAVGMSSSMMGSAYKAPMPYKVSNHYAFGDKMLFVKTQQTNQDVWKAVTVQGTDFYLAPESVKALRMKIAQQTTSAIGSVVEVAISAPKQNPLLLQDWRGTQYFVVTAAFD